jgi:hypothetical protein
MSLPNDDFRRGYAIGALIRYPDLEATIKDGATFSQQDAKKRGATLKRAQALDQEAKSYGFVDWNHAAAGVERARDFAANQQREIDAANRQSRAYRVGFCCGWIEAIAHKTPNISLAQQAAYLANECNLLEDLQELETQTLRGSLPALVHMDFDLAIDAYLIQANEFEE